MYICTYLSNLFNLILQRYYLFKSMSSLYKIYKYKFKVRNPFFYFWKAICCSLHCRQKCLEKWILSSCQKGLFQLELKCHPNCLIWIPSAPLFTYFSLSCQCNQDILSHNCSWLQWLQITPAMSSDRPCQTLNNCHLQHVCFLFC
jgi:hypothetical protein